MRTRIIHFLVKYILFPSCHSMTGWPVCVTNYPRQFVYSYTQLPYCSVAWSKGDHPSEGSDAVQDQEKSTGIWVGILLLFLSGVIVVLGLRYSDKIEITVKKPGETVLPTEIITETDTEKRQEKEMSFQQDTEEEVIVIETEMETEPETESETVRKTTEEFLTDFKASYDRREAVYGQNAGARREWMSSEAWNAYLETCVEAERDFYEKYQDASFEDLNIQYLLYIYWTDERTI